jgi:prephenate dehydratase
LLLKHKLWINGEVYLHISQCLLGFQGTTLENIREVYSHPVALAQCEQFLDIHLPESKRFEYHDTAGAAADIKKWGDLKRAAIASQHAAETYGLSILKKEIETHKDNYTRFVVLSKDRIQESQANKTSLVLGIADQMRGIGDRPGALYNVLGAFAKQNINLTKLQSRPLIGRAWHYIFYADVDCGLKQPAMQAALADLEYQRCAVTILGSYRSSRV